MLPQQQVCLLQILSRLREDIPFLICLNRSGRLRTDSLYLFDWTLFGEPIRVSQALSIVMVAVALFVLVHNIAIKKKTPDGLLVNQIAACKAAEETCSPESTEENQVEE